MREERTKSLSRPLIRTVTLAKRVLSPGLCAPVDHLFLFPQEFLAASSSQLTYYGLSQLHEKLRDDTLCVFFRNNHFCTGARRGAGAAGLLSLLLPSLCALIIFLHRWRFDRLPGPCGPPCVFLCAT